MNKIIQEPYSGTNIFISFCFILKNKINLLYILSFVFIRFITHCPFLLLVVIPCHSLSFVVTRCISRLSFYKRSSDCLYFLRYCAIWIYCNYCFPIRWRHNLEINLSFLTNLFSYQESQDQILNMLRTKTAFKSIFHHF